MPPTPSAAPPRHTHTELLLHDNLHLLPQLRPPAWEEEPRAASPAVVKPWAAELVRLTPYGAARVGLPRAPLDVARHVKEAVAHSEELGSAGGPLLCESVQEDERLRLASARFDRFAGNAMCAVCRDGPLPSVAHAQGDGMDTLALRRVDTPGAAATAAVALPAGRRVLQLVAAEDAAGGAEQRRLLVARTLHWLHLVMAEVPLSAPASLRSLAALKLRRPLHVCSSPHLLGEAACLQADGSLSLLRLDAPGALSTAALGSVALGPSARSSHTASADADAPPEALWGSVEYGMHPRTLYVATACRVMLQDLRQPSAALLIDLSGVPHAPLLGGALAVPPRDACVAAPLLALSSTEQLLLYDARSPRAPRLQWRMPLPTPAAAPVRAPERMPGREATARLERQLASHRLPHYFCAFDEAGQLLDLIDRHTGHPLAFPLHEPHAPSRHPLPLLPSPPPLATTPDAECMLRRRLREAELACPGRALPLAGAVVMRPSRGGGGGGGGEPNGGPHPTSRSQRALLLTAAADIEMLRDRGECGSAAGEQVAAGGAAVAAGGGAAEAAGVRACGVDAYREPERTELDDVSVLKPACVHRLRERLGGAIGRERGGDGGAASDAGEAARVEVLLPGDDEPWRPDSGWRRGSESVAADAGIGDAAGADSGLRASLAAQWRDWEARLQGTRAPGTGQALQPPGIAVATETATAAEAAGANGGSAPAAASGSAPSARGDERVSRRAERLASAAAGAVAASSNQPPKGKADSPSACSGSGVAAFSSWEAGRSSRSSKRRRSGGF